LKRIIIFVLVLLVTNVYSEDWYISNAAGMMIEKTFSQAALREAYALKIETHEQNQIPAELLEYIDSAIAVPETFFPEIHILYENGEEKNQRWILRYAKGNPWIVISIKKNDSQGFVEYYDESKLLIREDTFLDTNILSNRYQYYNELILTSETWQIPRPRIIDEENITDEDILIEDDTISINDEDILNEDNIVSSKLETELLEEILPETEKQLYSDVYHYARTGSLRSIERIFHSDSEENEKTLSRFSSLVPASEKKSEINSAPPLSSDFFYDIFNQANTFIEYVTDDQGNIISEIHTDEEGNKIGELTNIWSGARLASMSWNGENDVRRIEYEYDENGNRLIERNYRDDMLERLVRTEEENEVEELYLQGSLMLRALWKDGQKVSEEYFRPKVGNKSPGNLPGRNP
jgi:hypothetical protein